MAGVGEILSHYLTKLGHSSIVLQLKQYDPFGYDYYGKTLYFESVNRLMDAANSMKGNADAVIIHDFDQFLPLFEDKKAFMFYHGTFLRTKPKNIDKPNVFVSTEDLLAKAPNATVCRVPCDTELFKSFGKKRKGWVAINRAYQRDIVEEQIRRKYPNVTYIERNKDTIIPYSEMPQMLNKYENYVDMKYTYDKYPIIVNALSATGVQALASGCKVWNYDGLVPITELDKYDPLKLTEEFLAKIT